MEGIYKDQLKLSFSDHQLLKNINWLSMNAQSKSIFKFSVWRRVELNIQGCVLNDRLSQKKFILLFTITQCRYAAFIQPITKIQLKY